MTESKLPVLKYLNSQIFLIVHGPDNFLLPVTGTKSNNTFMRFCDVTQPLLVKHDQDKNHIDGYFATMFLKMFSFSDQRLTFLK